jgi:hypothetical protein
MAKITRKTQKIFGGSASADPLGISQFGSLAASAAAYSLDPDVIQALAAWLAGWNAATVGSNSPALEDMNAVHYVMARQLAYLCQQGMAEYDAGTTYYTDSLCTYEGDIWISLSDDNLANTPAPGSADWRLLETIVKAKVEWDGSIAATWTEATSGDYGYWKGLAYGGGIFVAVGGGIGTTDCILTSTDGFTWTLGETGLGYNWSSVAYGAGVFVAVTTGGKVATSPDGVIWTEQTAAAALAWTSVCFGNALFVAVALGGSDADLVMTSPDGENWTLQTAASNQYWNCVKWCNDKFIATASSGTTERIMTSANGAAWVARTTPNKDYTGVTYGNSIYVAVGGSSVLNSADGETWVERDTAAHNWESVAYGNGYFIAGANGSAAAETFYASTDGAAWGHVGTALNASPEEIIYENGVFYAVNLAPGTTGSIQYSQGFDGILSYSMPFQADNYKKYVVYAEDFDMATDSIVLTFPRAFTRDPYVYGKSGAWDIVTASTVTKTTVTITSSVIGHVVGGLMFIEGY